MAGAGVQQQHGSVGNGGASSPSVRSSGGVLGRRESQNGKGNGNASRSGSVRGETAATLTPTTENGSRGENEEEKGEDDTVVPREARLLCDAQGKLSKFLPRVMVYLEVWKTNYSWTVFIGGMECFQLFIKRV